MPGCAIFGCSNSTEKGFIMKCFPRDPVRRHDWALRTRRANWFPSNNSFLCEVHFAPDMWEKVRVDGKRKLKHNAVPTIFPFKTEPLDYEGGPDPEAGIDTSVSYNEETIVEEPTGNIPLDSSNDNITVPEVNKELRELRQKLAKSELLYLRERKRCVQYRKELQRVRIELDRLKLKYKENTLLSQM